MVLGFQGWSGAVLRSSGDFGGGCWHPKNGLGQFWHSEKTLLWFWGPESSSEKFWGPGENLVLF